MANDNKLVNLADLKAAFDDVNGRAGVTSVNGQTGAVSITPENIKAFKQIPGYITREMLDDYSIKYWYGGKINASVALAIGLPPNYDENGNVRGHEWFVLNMSKDDDTDSSWTRQVFYQLDGSMIYQRTCSYHTWEPVTKVSIIDDYGHAATIKQEVISGARSFVLHSCGNVYPHVGAIFKETGLQLWDYNNGSELWWLPKVIGIPQGGTDATNPAEARANLEITPENIGAFKQIPGDVTRAILDDYNIKYWYGAHIVASVAVDIGLPNAEWFVLNMPKNNDADSSWTRQVFYELNGSRIYQRTCECHEWKPFTKVSIIDDYGHAATIKQEVISGARSFVLHSCGNVYPDVGAIFKETGLQLWDYNNVSQLWWFPKEIGSAPPISLNLHDDSREIVLAEISKVAPGYTAPIFITSNGCSHLTGGHLSLYLSGTIARSTPGSVVIMAAEMSPATAIYTWRVDNLLDPNNLRFGAITKYTGAVI